MKKKEEPFVIADLISRYLKGELSVEELAQLREWAHADHKNQAMLEGLENGETLEKELAFYASVDKDSAWRKLTHTLKENPEQRTKPLMRYWRYAAAIMVMGVFLYATFELAYKRKSSQISKVEVPPLRNDLLPGGDKATLTLSDGLVIALEDMRDGTVKEENGIRISKNNGQIAYEIINIESPGEVYYHTIRTPVGGQYHVVLPDGSKVWLNSESSLHFPTVFRGTERVVDLAGEGYFEIAKNPEMPFLVHTEKTNVKVLGTHFNLMAYPNELFSQTTLLEGSVEVSDGVQNKTLKPGQQAFIGGGISIKKVNPDEAIAWKNGYFLFESEDLKTILRQLRRWYGFEIVNDELVPNKHFTAYISRNNTLSQVLKMLEMSGELKFKIDGKKLYIRETP
tara:strand:+ start:631 stop:1821 length:1191 start_codon:yes stop_codon:yes gene_type:complete